MRLILILLALIVFTSCAFSQIASADFKKLGWLIGDWNRTNVKAGSSGFEVWTKKSATEMHGAGIHLKGTDTTFVEKIKLILKDRDIFYVANVPENKEPVSFKLTNITDSSFTCQNLQHDFPKAISYKRDGEILKATISGDGKSIDYLFVKKQ